MLPTVCNPTQPFSLLFNAVHPLIAHQSTVISIFEWIFLQEIPRHKGMHTKIFSSKKVQIFCVLYLVTQYYQISHYYRMVGTPKNALLQNQVFQRNFYLKKLLSRPSFSKKLFKTGFTVKKKKKKKSTYVAICRNVITITLRHIATCNDKK